MKERKFEYRKFTLSERDIQRFWTLVDIRDESECWGWTKYRCKPPQLAYGIFSTRINNGKTPKQYFAHRVAYYLTCGEIPQGLMVCHRCDNPGCCNPRHLFLGTAKDNMDDKIEKGRDRYVVGAEVITAKLSEDQVKEIIRKGNSPEYSYRGGLTKLSKEYDVGITAVYNIVNGLRWKHIDRSAVLGLN